MTTRRQPRRLTPLVGMPTVHEGPTTVLPRLDAEAMAQIDADVEAGQDPIVSYSPDTARLRLPAAETEQLPLPRTRPATGRHSTVPRPRGPERDAGGDTPAPTSTPVPAVPAQYRPELQGLRALAAMAVVVYHVWVGRVSGGVDVFFVITGFLATGQLVRACERGTVDVIAHWGRTLRRLAPPMALVLLVTVGVSMALLPESRWLQTIHEVVASALFFENWRLAADSVDYYAAHDSASVVQHFWSLSIQVQFTLVFPVLLVLAAIVAHRRGWAVRDGALILLSGVTAASFVYSVVLTATEQQLAYFHSLTRVWEFTAGGLLALLVGHPTGRPVLRWLLGWAGIAGLLACGIVLDVAGGFPGYLALWPVLSACAVLAAGTTGLRLSADRLLTSAPLRYLGDISFPLYLWHWPVLLFTLLLSGRADPGLELGLVVIALSLALAAATHHLVETPLRDWSPVANKRWGGHAVVAIVLLPALALTAVWQVETSSRAASVGAVGDPSHPGAAVREPLAGISNLSEAPLQPTLAAAPDDWVEYKQDCSWLPYPVLERCTPLAAADPTAPTIVVTGDSHAQQLLAAVLPVARERGWRVQTLIRGNCPFSTTSDSTGDPGCAETNRAAISYLQQNRPAVVVTHSSRNARPGLTEVTPPGFLAAWDELGRAGLPVLAVRDNPRFTTSPTACLESAGRNAPECAVPREQIYAPELRLPSPVPDNVTLLDLSDRYCDDRSCPPELGNVLVYLDNNHLTATYAASLAPVVGARMAELVDR